MQGLPGPQGATGETGKPGEQVKKIAVSFQIFSIWLDLGMFMNCVYGNHLSLSFFFLI